MEEVAHMKSAYRSTWPSKYSGESRKKEEVRLDDEKFSVLAWNVPRTLKELSTPQLANLQEEKSAKSLQINTKTSSNPGSCSSLASTSPQSSSSSINASNTFSASLSPSPTKSPTIATPLPSKLLSAWPTGFDTPSTYTTNPPTSVDAAVTAFGLWSDQQRNAFLMRVFGKFSWSQLHLLSNLIEQSNESNPSYKDMLAWLPYELSLKILSYLDAVSLCRCSRVCSAWRVLATDGQLWRSLLDRDCFWWINAQEWSSYEDKAETDTFIWKRLYADKFRLKRNWTEGNVSVRIFRGHKQHISCLQFDENRIVSGSSDHTVRVWNMKTNTKSILTLYGHSGTVRCLQFDAHKVISGSNDCTIRIWDITDGRCLGTLRGHIDPVRCLQFGTTESIRNVLVSGSYDRTIKVWDLEKRECVRTIAAHDDAVLCVQFDETKIVSGSADKSIKVWDVLTGTCLRSFFGHADAVSCLQFDRSKIISGSLDSSLRFWRIADGECFLTLDWMRSEGHKGVVRTLQFDSWLMVSGADDKTVKVWNLHTGQRMLTLQRHTDGVTCLQFSQTKIVSGSYDKTIILWDFAAV